jgi:hypothetical protein
MEDDLMRVLRTRCISTKVTEEEYGRLELLAGEQTLSEWARAVLLKAGGPSIDHVLLAELLSLRTILLNLHFALANGEQLTAEAMHRLITCADHGKSRRVHECIAALTLRTDP